ncbi:MAG: hypothetical protein JWL73_974 [Actinomycetia bacterium]|nr:hypothetical protein [Actinomycetes bacterium]
MNAHHRLDSRLERHPLVRKVAACMTVSFLTTSISLSTLATLTAGFGVKAWFANVIATAVGTFPSYRLNRRWVWRHTDASDPWREVLPFWIMSFTGLALSTLAVAITDHWAASHGLASTTRTIAVLAANVGSFGLLWVAQFVMLDRVLFRSRAGRAGPPTIRGAGL